MEQIPVYAFTGFLDSGKTKFIQETLEDERFNAGEKTLLLLFEEGEEEYDLSTYPHKNVYIEVLDQQTVTTKQLQALQKKYKAERIVAELNGMQQVGDLYMRFPESWVVAQEVMFADSTRRISSATSFQCVRLHLLMESGRSSAPCSQHQHTVGDRKLLTVQSRLRN